jgi:hypothetical protein
MLFKKCVVFCVLKNIFCLVIKKKKKKKKRKKESVFYV